MIVLAKVSIVTPPGAGLFLPFCRPCSGASLFAVFWPDNGFYAHFGRPSGAQGRPKGAQRAQKEPQSLRRDTQKSLKNRPGAPSGKKGGPGGSRGAPGRENDTKIDEKTTHFDTEDMQKKASIPPCFSTVLGGKTGGTVPKKGEHSVFFLFFQFGMQCNAIQYNAIQYNTIQYSASTQKSAAQPNARKSAMSCSVPGIRYALAIAMPSSRGGRSEAQSISTFFL